MAWHIIAQIGADDYLPVVADDEPRLVATIDKPGSRFCVTQGLLSEVFASGLTPSQAAIDLVHLAAIAYTADLRTWRGYTSEDAWTRQITLHVPVTEPDLWNAATPALTEFLSFLTGDEWTILFREKIPHKPFEVDESCSLLPQSVCLFSGGLDSFVGAIDLLSTGQRVALVGHYGNSQREQIAAHEALRPGFESQIVPLWFYLVPPKMDKDHVVDSTMRARSFLFLALGTVVASALPPGAPLYVPENGLISLNVPLTFGRAGTHSTRTTHPHTINLFRTLLDKLGIEVVLSTPYRFMTKGEMLRDCKDQDVLKSAIHSTMSCSRPQAGRFHHRPVGQHCGYCVPCIIRRASLHAVGLDCEPHILDVLDTSIKANTAAGRDKRAFLMAITRLSGMTALQVSSELLSAGPVDGPELDGLVAVFRRGLEEVQRFLQSTT